jgi:hypothetical protein
MDVGEETGGEILLRLDQRDLDRALLVLVDVARDRAAARPAADHHQLRLGLAEDRGREQRSGSCREAKRGETAA